jgi:hypothetical protein
MDPRRKSNLAAGLILILVGVGILAWKLFPALQVWRIESFTWPLIIIAVGAAMLIFGLLGGSPNMAVPAFVLAGIGGILYWQNNTGNWDSWIYAWTLIPGFSGLGEIVYGLLGDNTGRRVTSGLRSVLVSAILFFIMGSVFGELNLLGPYWPVLIIGVGVYMLVRALIRRPA